MSLDYPEYEELRKKSRFLGLLWRLGDMGTYFGLIGAIASPLMVINNQFANRKTPLPWNKAIEFGLISILFFVVVFLSAGQLKCFAIERGKKLKSKS